MTDSFGGPGRTTRPIVRVQGLKEYFPLEQGVLRRVHGHVQAVDGVDLVIWPGESVGLVGESGSGKSTLGRLITRLIEPTGGTIEFEGRDITHTRSAALGPLRKHLQIVFQDPYTSLAPYSTVGAAVGEPLRRHMGLKGKALDQRVEELFRMVQLSPSYRTRYPNEFSGGQLQRISIARALATRPRMVVLDEPVSSLDVSIQAGVINLLGDIRAELDLTFLFISHDLSVVRHVSERTAVMYLGRILEIGPTEVIYTNVCDPYTAALLSAIPVPNPADQRSWTRIVLEGDIPSPINPPKGCRFHTRCPYAMDVCAAVDPPAATTPDGVTVFCHLHPPSVTPSTDAGRAPESVPDVGPAATPTSAGGAFG